MLPTQFCLSSCLQWGEKSYQFCPGKLILHLFWKKKKKKMALMVYQKGHCALFENDVKALVALCHCLTKFHNTQHAGDQNGTDSQSSEVQCQYSISYSLFTLFFLSCLCEIIIHVQVLTDLHFFGTRIWFTIYFYNTVLSCSIRVTIFITVLQLE